MTSLPTTFHLHNIIKYVLPKKSSSFLFLKSIVLQDLGHIYIYIYIHLYKIRRLFNLVFLRVSFFFFFYFLLLQGTVTLPINNEDYLGY